MNLCVRAAEPRYPTSSGSKYHSTRAGRLARNPEPNRQLRDPKPVVDRTYSLSETADAIRYVEARHVRGKVVVTTGAG